MNPSSRKNDLQSAGMSDSDMGILTGNASTPGEMARAAMVNRTHRVVRERALVIQARRNKVRSLWVPTLICSALVLILSTAVWAILDQYELEPTGIPDASQQILVLLLWFLPLSAGLLAMVWFRRSRQQMEEEQR
ncbi:hypothetical protein SAMN05421770_104371 [Granulicella rosea]|uniref:Uncharacterized protein n=1 Tax=Granulicella rosea TaxID=474952 RepID=A0A239KA14_9BACT|nr:hypothetical protein [Granulicella rosea]SNT14469.1 hypothetical protein SAMN05421770_104371 [Granulicella rosea]